ncbi:MAG: cysteine--tRNA ligase [Candidatus Zambryskibacteria bacterium RIFOXYC1_FULL_39_10]|uniref:Cysteine--tRNA ligase n=1 Tax=Candidatus Zambryskibacteria bacterium RIFOXYC1_FULL_39_10 TaxID=1802779 RepID=A0A1G2V3N1_9BACT|nr:MAG: cysteine--tRNA ligase [Candidatus Zambryskibacteria bacterium RIFOXYC1_FULL_39_10]OHB16768.1 MAG: cysteine--tRNA ligase [Candidatus Zambryskibacteria bacterium RIFOXYD1_FULL_39_35]
MQIKIHNTLSGQKELFSPINPKEVRMYNCGPTVYYFAHIGNMRAYVFADILRKTLEYFDYRVKQVINITDVGHLVDDGDAGDDKVESTAKKEGKSATEIARFYEKAYLADLIDLNISTENTIFPRATEHIGEQIEIIKILLEKGFAYQTSDGIYFDTSKFEGYGKLGNINISEQKEGARVEKNSEKINSTDFALWKFSPKADSGQPARLQEWPSPWGRGFPGWHIECSAMSRKYLDQPFDIHTGGIDHIPVHHNNEIAQSECAFDAPLANYWLHNAFITVEGEKMSKSLSNTYTISDLKQRKIHPLSFRHWLLSGHYRSPMNFTWDSVLGSQKALEKLVFEFSNLPNNETDEDTINQLKEFVSDDLNTPKTLALLHEAFGQKKSQKTISEIDKVLGLNIAKLANEVASDIPDHIQDLKKERDLVRHNKNWQKSDELRKEIEREGFVLEDKENDSIIKKTLSSLI